MRPWIFQLTSSSQPHYGPGFYSASNRNEHKEHSWGIMDGRSIWQLHRYLWADDLEHVGASTSHNLMGLHDLLLGQLYPYNKPLCNARSKEWHFVQKEIFLGQVQSKLGKVITLG
jgi:hypothetical protein